MADTPGLSQGSLGAGLPRSPAGWSGQGRIVLPSSGPRKAPRRRPGPGEGDSLTPGDEFAMSQGRGRLLRLTVPFVGFALYTWVAITFQLGLAQPAVLLGLLGLLTVAPVRFPRFLVLLAAWVLWSAVGLKTTQHPDLVATEVEVLVKVGLIVFLGVNALRTRAQIRAFMVLVCLGYGMYPARGTIINFARGYTIEGRALWNYVYSNPNDLATISVMALAIAAGLYVAERKGAIRMGALATLLVLPVLVALTQSRGGFLGLLVFSTVAAWGHVRIRLPRFRTVFVTLVFVLVAASVVPEEAWSRFGQLSSVAAQVRGLGESSDVASNLNDLEDRGSAAQRFQVWGLALKIAGDHPVAGVGQGAYAQVHGEYDRSTRQGFGAKDAHSTYLTVLAETGVVGLLLFLAMLATVFTESERVRKRMVRTMPRHARQLRVLQAGLLGFMVAGVFGSYGRVSFLYLLLVVIWACTRQARSELKRLGSPVRLPSRGSGPIRNGGRQPPVPGRMVGLPS